MSISTWGVVHLQAHPRETVFRHQSQHQLRIPTIGLLPKVGMEIYF